MGPLISFIVTYHNEPASLLLGCIDSILSLRLKPAEAEIIVVDDGSKVPPPPLPAPVVCIRQEESGLSVCRNTGISRSHGRYIQFVDADDRLLPEAYSGVCEALRGAGADLVLFGMKRGRDVPRGCRAYRQDVGTKAERTDGRSYLQHRNLRAAAWSYAFSRDILGDLRFCPGLLHEDELFTPQLFLRAERLVELPVAAYFYRQHSGTITQSHVPEHIQKRLDDIRRIISVLDSLNEPLLERRVRQLCVDYLQLSLTLTGSPAELYRRAAELRREGLLPLPLRPYSLRYLVLSVVFNLLSAFSRSR